MGVFFPTKRDQEVKGVVGREIFNRTITVTR